MVPEKSFHHLLEQLQEGDESAVPLLIELYGGRLLALARARLSQRLQQKLDPEDILQSVLRTFWTRHADGRFYLRDAGGLWALLARITVRKCVTQVQRFHTDRRNVGAEFSPDGDDRAAINCNVISREPDPEEAAALADTLEAVLRGLDSVGRAIIERRLQCLTQEEIAEQLGIAKTTVQRVVNRVGERLQRLLLED